MLETLISSKTRIKLLQKFFLNSSIQSYLRGLESEFGESTNAIRLELNKFEKAGMIRSENVGNKKIFKANEDHPLFYDLQNIVRKYMGIDHIVENIARKLGDLNAVYLIGDYANGIDRGVIDLIFVSGKLNNTYLIQLIEKAERLLKRKIRYMKFKSEFEAESFLNNEQSLLIWSQKEK